MCFVGERLPALHPAAVQRTVGVGAGETIRENRWCAIQRVLRSQPPEEGCSPVEFTIIVSIAWRMFARRE